MGNPLPYFPFYPSDFFEDEPVQLMSPYGWGCYLKLLAHQWREGSVPSDQLAVESLCLPRTGNVYRAEDQHNQFEAQWELLLECFEDIGDDRMVNPRLERERSAALEKSQKARQAVQERERKRTIIGRSSDDHLEGEIIERSSMQSQMQSQKQKKTQKKSKPPTSSEPLSLEASEPCETSSVPSGRPARSRSQANGPHHEFIAWWVEAWREHRLGTEYAVQGAKDGSAVASLLKKPGADLDEIKRRAIRLLEHPEAWMAQHASLALLNSKWNDLAVEIVPKPRNTGTDWDALYEQYGIGGSNGKA